jgi:hypothetical protein
MDIVERVIALRDASFSSSQSGRRLFRLTQSERDVLAEACNEIVELRKKLAQMRDPQTRLGTGLLT